MEIGNNTQRRKPCTVKWETFGGEIFRKVVKDFMERTFVDFLWCQELHTPKFHGENFRE